jgi:hypothetical protein
VEVLFLSSCFEDECLLVIFGEGEEREEVEGKERYRE